MLRDRPVGASLAETAREATLTPEAAAECVSSLREAGKVLDLSSDLFIHAECYKACLDEAAARSEAASSTGQSLSLTMRDLRQGLDWPPALWSRIQGDLEAQKLVTRRGGQFVLETAVEKLGEEDRVLMEKVLAIYDEAGFQSPRPGAKAAPRSRACRSRPSMIQKKGTFIQTLSLLVLHSSWGLEFKYACNPVLSCHSCALAWFACPVGVFVHYSGYHLFPLFAQGTVLLLGILFGRLLCGWVCPFGFVQDLLHKIPSPKLSLPGWTSNIKYAILISTVFLTPYFLGEATDYSFCRVCPASALQVTVPNLVGGAAISVAAGVKLSVLAVVLALVVFSERAFCNTLCPIGALLAPLNFLSFWAVKTPDAACLECKKYDKACPTAAAPSVRIERGVAPSRDLDCIVCHQCQTVCPQHGPSPRLLQPKKVKEPGEARDGATSGPQRRLRNSPEFTVISGHSSFSAGTNHT